MGVVISKLKNQDLDKLFTYNTPKVVKVMDRRLGIPYYTFMFVIFIYILYTVIVNQRYLITEEPGGGSIRTTLRTPDYVTNNYKENYEDYKMNSKSYKWIYWSPTQIVYPAGQDGCLFITTRVTERSLVYENSDSANDNSCNPFLPTKRECRTVTSKTSNSYVVADIEPMTIMVEHTIRGNLLPITEVNSKLYGELLDKDDNVIWKFYPKDNKEYEKKLKEEEGESSYFDTDEKKYKGYTIRSDDKPGDIFNIDILLHAANFKLDDINNNEETYRYSGCVIVVIIEYNNKQNLIEYKYKPSLIENAEMKVLELVTDVNHVNSKVISSLNNDEEIKNESVGWIEYNRHGIEIKFVQLGNIGQFDFMALCMNLVASIAMLSVASTVVESLMLYILPEKGVYRRYKFEITDDFSDIRDNEKSARKEEKRRMQEEEMIRQKAASADEV
ncbi:hypothetical protein H8356DRAFT_1709489 [Neocallimastix lanati (nom. inval.)]|jgi:hypothetical protein|uniref:Uncharacterized protein n=1 Tax=Neocallimastix californiae TaxID=1754190 RepID=A0A1Y2DJE5_9FUNG|nr:hypothetical protein H8356DRAFT_1709489 [Neocallimastix sp. JGI-2020a]ORY59378.1 hypothetical protein LY90DRAFT_668868 [Neocallimastix californiae]|eukprot:ORY59378.1 hypothetical protein LY90DRAFT_668868 [Neocallimastix californiae]